MKVLKIGCSDTFWLWSGGGGVYWPLFARWCLISLLLLRWRRIVAAASYRRQFQLFHLMLDFVCKNGTAHPIVWKLVPSNLSVCMFYRFGQVQTELSDVKHGGELNRSDKLCSLRSTGLFWNYWLSYA